MVPDLYLLKMVRNKKGITKKSTLELNNQGFKLEE